MLTQKVLSHWKLIPVSFLIRKVWNAVSFRTVVVGLKTTTGEYEIWWAKYLIPDRNDMLWVTRCVACSLHLSSWKCYVSLLESASTTVGISLWENDCVVIGEDHFQLLLWLFFWLFSVCLNSEMNSRDTPMENKRANWTQMFGIMSEIQTVSIKM